MWMGMSWMEIIASVSGLLCVFLIVKNNVWNWPIGLVQVFLYIFIFYQAKLYSDAFLQVFYVVTGIFGWWFWLRGKNKTEVPISRISLSDLTIWSSIAMIGTMLWGFIMHHYTDAAFPYCDGFIVVLSFIAQYLLCLRKVENWYFWIAVDLMAMYVYPSKHLYMTAGLYAVFLGLCISGLITWTKTFNKERVVTDEKTSSDTLGVAVN